jgi:hypothetical protein
VVPSEGISNGNDIDEEEARKAGHAEGDSMEKIEEERQREAQAAADEDVLGGEIWD